MRKTFNTLNRKKRRSKTVKFLDKVSAFTVAAILFYHTSSV